ncbi:MAG: S49 family peptidase [Thermomonas sp.]|nr:S49 family peptidase [Thermomonas sp.]
MCCATDRMLGGYASMREVAPALARLRASGKQVVAFGESMDQSQYLLAAQANEIYLDPMGRILLEGLGQLPPATTAMACRTSSASTCTCSRSASSSRRASPTSSTRHRLTPRKPTCSG